MRKTVPETLEKGRIKTGKLGSNSTYGFYGAFEIIGPMGATLIMVISGADDTDKDSEGWEHASVSLHNRCPNWFEMCFVKNLCWDEEECVIQFHPPKSEYINNHNFCLHLWRHKTFQFKMPPKILIGE